MAFRKFVCVVPALAMLLQLPGAAYAQTAAVVDSEPVKYVREYNRVADHINELLNKIGAAKDAAEFDGLFHELRAFVNHPGTDRYSNLALCAYMKGAPASHLSYLESIIESPDASLSLASCQGELLTLIERHSLQKNVSLDISQDINDLIRPLPYEERTVPNIGYLSMQGFKDKEVMLTFDDGPTQKTTGPILDALKKAGIKAGFFSTGRQAKYNSDLVKRILAEGHVLGSHSYYHTLMMGREVNRGKMSYDYFMNEFVGGHMGVFAAGGYIDPYFRFPNGCMNKNMKANVNELGLKIFGWSVDSFDWQYSIGKYPDAKARQQAILASFVKQLRAANNKGIVLMHDVFRQSAEALPLILRYLADNGFKVVLLKPENRDMRHLPMVTQAVEYLKAERLQLKDLIPPSKDGSTGIASMDFQAKVNYQRMFPQLSYQYSPVDPLAKGCGE